MFDLKFPIANESDNIPRLEKILKTIARSSNFVMNGIVIHVWSKFLYFPLSFLLAAFDKQYDDRNHDGLPKTQLRKAMYTKFI